MWMQSAAFGIGLFCLTASLRLSDAQPTTASAPNQAAPNLNGTFIPGSAQFGNAGLTFYVVDVGPRTAPTILLLHGFPDSSNVWRNQVPAFLSAGYRVIAPDLRGFGQTSKPQNVSDYTFTSLLLDVVWILYATGAPSNVTLVAHDYGTALGTYLAQINGAPGSYLPTINKYVMCSTGHYNLTAKYADAVLQRQLSWYELYFQAVGVAEAGIADQNFTFWRTVFAPDTYERAAFIVDEQIAGLSLAVGNTSNGALVSALGWYRGVQIGVPASAFNLPPLATSVVPITVPTLGLLGDSDAYISEKWMLASGDPSLGLITNYTFQTINGAGHWLQLEQPAEVTQAILNFLHPPAVHTTTAQVYLTVTLSQYALAQFLASVEPLFLDTIEAAAGTSATVAIVGASQSSAGVAIALRVTFTTNDTTAPAAAARFSTRIVASPAAILPAQQFGSVTVAPTDTPSSMPPPPRTDRHRRLALGLGLGLGLGLPAVIAAAAILALAIRTEMVKRNGTLPATKAGARGFVAGIHARLRQMWPFGTKPTALASTTTAASTAAKTVNAAHAVSLGALATATAPEPTQSSLTAPQSVV